MTHHLEGQRFGNLRVVRKADTKRRGEIKWVCQCDCGQVSEPTSYDLVKAGVKRCRHCVEYVERKMLHGQTKHGWSPTYVSWMSMKRRVLDRSKPSHFGLRIDPKWETDFQAFVADMGERPEGKTLDRIDNDKGYDKDNCRWATHLEQSRNRKRKAATFEWCGRVLYLSDWAKEFGVSATAIARRIAVHGSPAGATEF